MADRAAPHLAERLEPDRGAGESVYGVRDPGRSVIVVSGAPRPAADAVLGPGHQLLAAISLQHDVVDERRAWHRDLPGGAGVQFPGRRPPRRARSAVPP